MNKNYENGVFKAKQEIIGKYPRFFNDNDISLDNIVWKRGDCQIIKDGFRFSVYKGDTNVTNANSLPEALTYIRRRYGLS